jgi:hypothetical protein
MCIPEAQLFQKHPSKLIENTQSRPTPLVSKFTIGQEIQRTRASAPYPLPFASPSSAPFHSALRRATALCPVLQTWIFER